MTKRKSLEREFHDAGFDTLWYAHPGDFGFKKRWYAGTETGKDNDLICVRPCSTTAECERVLSPGGATIREAVKLAIALKKKTGRR